jgi:hypothetical protein
MSQRAETPEGKMVGTETRLALVLILHDSSQPATTPANDWTPQGLYKPN